MSNIKIAGERLHQIILAPVVSEKASRVQEKGNQAVFKVLGDAQKNEIKQAVEKLFNVKVEGVRTLNVKGKTRGFGGRRGVRSDWKKAYVTLAEGSTIDVASGAPTN
jgi:large subunit ribosomal protein L23